MEQFEVIISISSKGEEKYKLKLVIDHKDTLDLVTELIDIQNKITKRAYKKYKL